MHNLKVPKLTILLVLAISQSISALNVSLGSRRLYVRNQKDLQGLFSGTSPIQRFGRILPVVYMIVVGVSWILYWALVDAFNLDSLKAALITGIVFILLGLVLGERPWNRA